MTTLQTSKLSPAGLRALCDAAEWQCAYCQSFMQLKGCNEGDKHRARGGAAISLDRMGFSPVRYKSGPKYKAARAYADLQERVEELEKALEEAAQLYHVAQNVVFNRRHKAATSKAWWGCPDGNCPKYAQLLNSGEKAIGSEG